MDIENDKTIFKYMNPMDNCFLSLLNKSDLKDIMTDLNKYFLEYRNCINVDRNITFGIEIEVDNFRGHVDDFWSFQQKINEIVGNENWITKNDWTLKWGREIASDILFDNERKFKSITWT